MTVFPVLRSTHRQPIAQKVTIVAQKAEEG